jgi:hypothetical protein
MYFGLYENLRFYVSMIDDSFIYEKALYVIVQGQLCIYVDEIQSLVPIQSTLPAFA